VTDSPTPPRPPAEITHLVRERTEARARRDWPAADALKARIEAAGWRVVDHGARTGVVPAAPASLEVDGEVRYGSAAAVPSRLGEPATAAFTVVLLASEQPERFSRLLAALRSHAPDRCQVVVVANDPSDAQLARLSAEAPDLAAVGGTPPEVLRTSTRLGYAAALNVGLQRAAGEIVLIADATARPGGDALTPLAAVLDDPTVAAAGGFGLVAEEPGRFRPNDLLRATAPAGTSDAASPRGGAASSPGSSGAVSSPGSGGADVAALEGAWLAFRRSDYVELGPLDERFVTPAWLDVWWTLRLRAGVEPEGAADADSDEADERPDADEAADERPETDDRAEADAPQVSPEIDFPAPRRAVAVALPLERDEAGWPPDRSRLNRRNMYRVLDRFGWRGDLS
jgi:Glycosyl transferase family 2